MNFSAAEISYPFFSGGGEMGELTRAHDWSRTPVGSPDAWPQSLRTIVGIILQSRFPMFLWWGQELTQFYNDAYRPSLGNEGKHPQALGAPGSETWPEIWPVIKPMIDQVLAGGEATWNEDQLIPIFRNGRLEDVYWTFSYSPVRDDSNAIAGVLVTCTETTGKVNSLQQLRTSEERLLTMTEGVNVLIAVSDDQGMTTYMNSAWQKFTGKPAEQLLLGGWTGLIHPDDYQQYQERQGEAVRLQTEFMDELRILSFHNSYSWFLIQGRPQLHPDGNLSGYVISAIDITTRKEIEVSLRKSEERLRSIIATAPAAIGLLVGRDLIIDTPNETFIQVIGRGPDIAGKSLKSVIPDPEQRSFLQILDDVYTSGNAFQAYGVRLQVTTPDGPSEKYFNVSFSPMTDESGAVYAILDVSIEVTDQILALRKQEESENRLRSLVESAPFPIGVYTGPEMIILLANQSILDVWGKGNDVIGRPYAAVLPELADQAIFEQLDEVYTSGRPFHSRNQRVNLLKEGVLHPYYFNYSFTPLFDPSGKVYGVMNTAADVTDLELSRQRAEAAESNLRGAVELAELSTWKMDIQQGVFHYSPRFMEWLGISEDIADRDAAYNPVPEDWRQSVAAAIEACIQPGGPGIYENEHPIINRITGETRIIHAQAQVFYDSTGLPLTLSGTARDVTDQRLLQQSLESQVQERTEELAATNEELQVTIEELAETNSQLLHSNEELAQYAYVASHDLQEPLRKIRIFTDMLAHHADMPSGSTPLIEKVSQSSERMSQLIRDLLDFSRLLKSDSLIQPVGLGAVAEAVAGDFELIIEEKQARIDIGALPEIMAVNLQMNQLFYNLMSNALKFSEKDRQPLISISSRLIPDGEVRVYIRHPLESVRYHEILFADNGIGFDASYSEQIFEVFKRLHGRDAYPGSGIGLALCRRIVENHNGHLFAESEPGKGSVFHVILPERLNEPVDTELS